jgi:predicted transcriptional regulator
MDAIWAHGEISVRDLMTVLNKRRRKARAYTTYLTVCVRLEGKGLAARRREGKTDLYRPAMPHEEYLARRAAADVDEMVRQYGDLALSHFARRVADLDPKRRRELERLAGDE